MTKREAKRWACGMAAALLASDMDGAVVEEADPDFDKKVAAMDELIAELKRREGDE